MTVIFFFTSVILSFLPLLHSATPTCPNTFSCPNLTPFKYPFYNATKDTSCGLIKVNCNLIGAEIQYGGGSYPILYKFDSNSSFKIQNKTFGELLQTKTCDALVNNITSPSPLFFSISIDHFITIFKCRRDPINATQETDAYFRKPNFNSYKNCRDHNFYYKHPFTNTIVPSNLSHRCQVIQLPVKVPWQFDNKVPDETNIFSLLSPVFSISFHLSASCQECNKNGSHCRSTDNGDFQCLYTKKEKRDKELTLILASCEECHKNGSHCRSTDKGDFQCLYTKKEKRDKDLTLILVLAGFAFILMLGPIIFIIRRRFTAPGGWRKKAEYNVNAEVFLKNQEFLAPKRYSYSQIIKMTNSFEDKLGQGGFGSVYKGTLRNQSLVAVKVLSEPKGNGEDFINEVASVGRTSHVNIVSLVGFCLEGRQRALIYEFMPNGSLERFIYGRSSSNCSQLGWKMLYRIAIGIARGLEYLDRGCNTRILHFDIKPHNILLDQEFCPKISDFGLAKLFPEKRSMISMSNMRGTPGYIAPEIFSRSFGGVSHKSDVYSYGMMILEMVGGRRNIEVEVDHTSEIYFPHWIYKKVELQEEQLGLHEIVNDEENEMARKMIIVGLWCIQTNPLSRPTITKVLEMLEGGLELLEIPPKPYMVSPSRSVDSSATD